MKITKKTITRLIQEELASLIEEGSAADFLQSFEFPRSGQPKDWNPAVERKFADIEAAGGIFSKVPRFVVIFSHF